MAFMKNINDLKGILTLVVLTLPSIVANIDCNGKAFHCVNSTHFMICVELGSGVSTTIDNFVIPCPPTTVCLPTNRFECEFPVVTTTTVAASAQPFDITTDLSETIGTETATLDYEVTTSIPFEEYFNTVGTTTLSEDTLRTQPDVTESTIITEVSNNINMAKPQSESNSTLNGTIQYVVTESTVADVTQIINMIKPESKTNSMLTETTPRVSESFVKSEPSIVVTESKVTGVDVTEISDVIKFESKTNSKLTETIPSFSVSATQNELNTTTPSINVTEPTEIINMIKSKSKNDMSTPSTPRTIVSSYEGNTVPEYTVTDGDDSKIMNVLKLNPGSNSTLLHTTPRVSDDDVENNPTTLDVVSVTTTRYKDVVTEAIATIPTENINMITTLKDFNKTFSQITRNFADKAQNETITTNASITVEVTSSTDDVPDVIIADITENKNLLKLEPEKSEYLAQNYTKYDSPNGTNLSSNFYDTTESTVIEVINVMKETITTEVPKEGSAVLITENIFIGTTEENLLKLQEESFEAFVEDKNSTDVLLNTTVIDSNNLIIMPEISDTNVNDLQISNKSIATTETSANYRSSTTVIVINTKTSDTNTETAPFSITPIPPQDIAPNNVYDLNSDTENIRLNQEVLTNQTDGKAIISEKVLSTGTIDYAAATQKTYVVTQKAKLTDSPTTTTGSSLIDNNNELTTVSNSNINSEVTSTKHGQKLMMEDTTKPGIAVNGNALSTRLLEANSTLPLLSTVSTMEDPQLQYIDKNGIPPSITEKTSTTNNDSKQFVTIFFPADSSTLSSVNITSSSSDRRLFISTDSSHVFDENISEPVTTEQPTLANISDYTETNHGLPIESLRNASTIDLLTTESVYLSSTHSTNTLSNQIIGRIHETTASNPSRETSHGELTLSMPTPISTEKATYKTSPYTNNENIIIKGITTHNANTEIVQDILIAIHTEIPLINDSISEIFDANDLVTKPTSKAYVENVLGKSSDSTADAINTETPVDDVIVTTSATLVYEPESNESSTLQDNNSELKTLIAEQEKSNSTVQDLLTSLSQNLAVIEVATKTIFEKGSVMDTENRVTEVQVQYSNANNITTDVDNKSMNRNNFITKLETTDSSVGITNNPLVNLVSNSYKENEPIVSWAQETIAEQNINKNANNQINDKILASSTIPQTAVDSQINITTTTSTGNPSSHISQPEMTPTQTTILDSKQASQSPIYNLENTRTPPDVKTAIQHNVPDVPQTTYFVYTSKPTQETMKSIVPEKTSKTKQPVSEKISPTKSLETKTSRDSAATNKPEKTFADTTQMPTNANTETVTIATEQNLMLANNEEIEVKSTSLDDKIAEPKIYQELRSTDSPTVMDGSVSFKVKKPVSVIPIIVTKPVVQASEPSATVDQTLMEPLTGSMKKVSKTGVINTQVNIPYLSKTTSISKIDDVKILCKTEVIDISKSEVINQMKEVNQTSNVIDADFVAVDIDENNAPVFEKSFQSKHTGIAVSKSTFEQSETSEVGVKNRQGNLEIKQTSKSKKEPESYEKPESEHKNTKVTEPNTWTNTENVDKNIYHSTIAETAESVLPNIQKIFKRLDSTIELTTQKMEETVPQSISNIDQLLFTVETSTEKSTPANVEEVPPSSENRKDSSFVKSEPTHASLSSSKSSDQRENITSIQSNATQTKLHTNHTHNASVPELNPSNATHFSNFVCNLSSRGRFSDNKDCKKFYICLGKVQPIDGFCPNNTVFSEIRKQCTNNLSHCIRNNQFQCVSEGRFSDYFNNNIYYICVKNNVGTFIRFKLQCQGGYHLNKTSVRCVLNTEAISGSDTSKNSEQSVSSSKSETLTEESHKKFECKKSGRFPDRKDCRKYYVCTKIGKSQFEKKVKECDSDEIFHKDKKKCVDADSYECS